MFKPKLIVTDLDGTALRNDKTLSQETIDAFAKCKEQQIPVAIATARYIGGAKPYAMSLQADYQILIDGTLILEKDNILYSNTLDIPITNKILQILKENNMTSHIAIPTTEGIYRYPEIASDTPKHFLIDLDKPFTQPANKFVVEISDECIANQIATECHCKHLRYRNENRYTFFHPTAGKLPAIKYITNHLGIDLDDVLVFGDDINDIEMITACGYGVAMGNALDEVKAVASAVTDTNEANGISKTLLRLL